MREKYETLSLAVLKELAKARGMKGISTLKKAQLIEAMLNQDEKDRAAAPAQADLQTQEAQSHEGNAASPGRGDGIRQEASAPSAPAGDSGREALAPSGSAGDSGQEASVPSGSAMGESRTSRRESRGQGRTAGNTRRMRTEGSDSRREREAAERSRKEYEPTERSRKEYEPTERSRKEYEPTERSRKEYEPTERSRKEYDASERPRREYDASERSRREYEPADRSRKETEAGDQPRRENEGSDPSRREHAENTEARTDRPPTELAQLDSGIVATGILEVMPDGFGFIRSDNYLPGENDVYVSPSQIRKFNLKTGDIISGNTRIKAQQEKFSALLYLKSINGRSPSEMSKRVNFEDMTPIFPNERLRMERGSSAVAMRIVDLFSPIGKGQRGMIVSPPKAGKTTLLKEVARSILRNDPRMRLLILLIDERPEEVTDIKEAIRGENVEVIYSTFDELPEHHKRVSEMVIERAKRLVEQKEDVTILLDSITRLARAYNLTVPPSGRTLSGGLDPAALHMPKRFFGAARNMREGGSLTILATALVDTGSKMDDVVYEEFKGTGNMELVLDRKLSEKRVFPAIDIPKSGTRREDLLLDREEQEAVYIMRRGLNGLKADEAVENILNTFVRTKDNRELVQRVRKQRFV